MHADQGTAVKHVGPSEKKSEESESFIYIRDILFILADKLGSLRASTSNGLWLFPPARVPGLSFQPDIVSVRLRHVLTRTWQLELN